MVDCLTTEVAGSFLDRLRDGPPVVADGGTGVVLTAAVPGLRIPEEANIRAPDAVVAVHVSFINAGAELIETNTFGAHRRKLAASHLEDDFERINSEGVKLARDAREVTGREVFIGGALGPGADDYGEQARLLEGRGTDLLLLETFYDLDELERAIASVREVSRLPIVALLSFDSDAVTIAGVGARDAGERLRALEVAAFGANHGRGPAAALAALAQMGPGPLAALPNVGLATMSGARIAFPHATPEYFAEFAAQARELGARMIGGCCGTTPAQIAAVRSAVDENRTAAARPKARGSHPVGPVPTPHKEEPAELERLLEAGEFVVSVQLDPPLGGDATGLLEAAARIKESGLAHVVDVNDNPRARARMSGIMVSAAIRRAAGIEVIPHLTPRDSTLSGLESTLLGAHAEGIRNVLAVTGDAPEAGDYPGAGSVYDVDAIGLVELMTRLNAGTDFHGRAIDAPTAFFPGVAVNPTADDLDLEAERFRRKVEAGALFAMTQVLFDLSYLEAFLERTGGSPIPLLVGVWPIRSLELAVRVHNETPGIVVPEHVQDRYRRAGAGAAEVGLELGRELIAGARSLASGVYVVAPFRRPLGVLELLEA